MPNSPFRWPRRLHHDLINSVMIKADNCQLAAPWFLKRTVSKSPNCSFLLFSPESFPPRHTLTITTETHQTPTIGPGSIHARTFRTGLHSRPNPYHSQALRLKSGRLDEIHRVLAEEERAMSGDSSLPLLVPSSSSFVLLIQVQLVASSLNGLPLDYLRPFLQPAV